MKKLGFGMMRLPRVNGNYGIVDLEETKLLVDKFMASGFTYFDTAAPYHRGDSEVAIRKLIVERYPRSRYTITDKLSLFMIEKKEDMESFFETQLHKLGVEYIDYYFLHALGEAAYRKATDFDAFSFIKQKKAEGRVSHIGFSYHDKAELLDEILTAHPEMEVVQLQLNYLDWDDPTIESRKCYEVCVKHKKPVIVMEPIKGGSLVNIPDSAKELFYRAAPSMSIASWAIRFAASPEHVMMVLSGMSDLAQVEDNISYMSDFHALNDMEQAIIEKASKIIRESIAIPCTACRYCVDDCPMHIAIPDYFAIYNNLKRFGNSQAGVASNYYENLTQKYGKASACIKCGKCEKHCPQHLMIRNFLKDVAAALEKK